MTERTNAELAAQSEAYADVLRDVPRDVTFTPQERRNLEEAFRDNADRLRALPEGESITGWAVEEIRMGGRRFNFSNIEPYHEGPDPAVLILTRKEGESDG